MKMRDYDKAIEQYSAAIAIAPAVAVYYHLRGTAYKAKGDLARANKDFDEEKKRRAAAK